LVYEPEVRALTVADDLLLTVSGTGALTRWNLNQTSRATARRVNISRAWYAQASSLIFSTARDEPGIVRVEDAATGSEVRRESFPDLDPRAVMAVVDEHDLLLAGDSSGRVHGRRASAVDEEVFLWQIHNRPKQASCFISSVAMHEDLLITAGQDGAVRFTNWRTGEQALAPVGHQGWSDKSMMAAIVVTKPGGETVILAGDTSGVLLCWQLSSLSSAAVFDDGFSMARATELTDIDNGRNLSLLTWLRQPNGFGQVAIPFARWSSSRQGYIQIIDIAARTNYLWQAHDRVVVALCDSGDLLYTADSSGIVRCWADVRERAPRLLSELDTNSKMIALLPLANKYVAIASTSGLAVVRCEAG
jgi:WD40 repeat protein